MEINERKKNIGNGVGKKRKLVRSRDLRNAVGWMNYIVPLG